MSYCRFAWGGSDVYVYGSDRGLECCGCSLCGGCAVFQEPEEMIQHLVEHRRAGHFVPEHAVMRLWSEIPGALRPVKPQPPLMAAYELDAAINRLMIARDEAKARDREAKRDGDKSTDETD